MITVEGSAGEGGDQILQTAVALRLCEFCMPSSLDPYVHLRVERKCHRDDLLYLATWKGCFGKMIRDLGVQDPEAKNSPVAWESDEEMETLRQAIPLEPFCYFNGERLSDGTVVKSGAILLRCSQGLWVQAGSSDPENP